MRPYDRAGDRLPPLPKPYAFVPFAPAGAVTVAPIGHDRYQEELLTGSIQGTLVALSPLHVASGSIELTGGQPSLVKAHFRCGDRPAIPGSSLKGAIRSIVEAISDPPSCARVTQARRDTLPPRIPACREVKANSRKDAQLCLACRMFGAMGYLGRLRFYDAIQEGEDPKTIQIPSLFQPRTRENIYYDHGQVKGRKFYMHGQGNGQAATGNVPIEVCPVGSQFPLRIEFDNLSREELGLLLVALGQADPPLFPKLGGGKPACCGSMRVEIASVTTYNGDALEFHPESASQDIEELVQDRPLTNMDRLNKLAAILRFPGKQPCPDRNY